MNRKKFKRQRKKCKGNMGIGKNNRIKGHIRFLITLPESCLQTDTVRKR